jgi:hypothetical protein
MELPLHIHAQSQMQLALAQHRLREMALRAGTRVSQAGRTHHHHHALSQSMVLLALEACPLYQMSMYIFLSALQLVSDCFTAAAG